MSVRSVLNNFNNCLLICGVGSINYSQRNFKKSVVFYVLRCMFIFVRFYSIYFGNTWVLNGDPEMSELTSIILISCLELYFIGNIICHFWRVFLDNQLSMVLNKLEAIHEKLIRLKVVSPMKIKISGYVIGGIIIYVKANILAPLLWMMNQKLEIKEMATLMVLLVCERIVLLEYMLLISYIKWMVYVINEQIPERRSCLSTFRDMYLEVLECLHQDNTSIYGLPVIVVFIAGSVADIIGKLYNSILFPRDYITNPYLVIDIIGLLTKTVNLLVLYMIGDATEKEINRISDMLHRRSVIERNPRIKRQIKIFLLRRLHEHYNFELYGICHINLRQLHSLSSKAIGYLVIQVLFRLNK
ncbi:uncharacterized protein LOC111027287 [Myzus persicae]|uniref:uncharacterized protein LOC111027287 n=1 Tax=Myzus persicae TaxID=13164 RepID=UPI000B934F77|nr:uncharacterized protein LOC111027287 [Myzus persicae]